jgi:hypothetical protein
MQGVRKMVLDEGENRCSACAQGCKGHYHKEVIRWKK